MMLIGVAIIAILMYHVNANYKPMTRCPLCGKKPSMKTTRVLLRGHYNPTSRKRAMINLQWARVDGKRTRVCTDCIKTLAKRAITV